MSVFDVLRVHHDTPALPSTSDRSNSGSWVSTAVESFTVGSLLALAAGAGLLYAGHWFIQAAPTIVIHLFNLGSH